MKRILVTTDFSANSKAGIRFAIQFASQTKCELIFYHIAVTYKSKGTTLLVENKNISNKIITQQKLNKFITSIYLESDLFNGEINCVVETGTDVIGSIKKYSDNNKIDYICLSTRGAGLIKKIIGTTISGLIIKSRTPVIAVPKNYHRNKITDIFYSTDLANLPYELAIVENMAKELSAKIHVYHYDYMADVDEVMARLQKAAHRYVKKNIDFNFKKMEIENSLSYHLQNDIANSKSSIVVLFTKQNKSWYDRLFLRNNSREAVFKTKIPLFILKKIF